MSAVIFLKQLVLSPLMAFSILKSSNPEILKCKTEINSKLSEILEVKSENITWIQAEPMSEGKVWRLRGAKLGWWAEITTNDNHVKKIIFINPTEASKYKLDEKCLFTKEKLENQTPHLELTSRII